jgi:flagellar hook-associated protein 1 FlgK
MLLIGRTEFKPMSGLFGSLSVALSGLAAEQAALEVTANNVANVNTPGYSRQTPQLAAGDPIVSGNLTLGTGVVLQGIESLRDPILELQLSQEMQDQGRLNTALNALQQMQVPFSSTTGDIGSSISSFFDSLNQLSTDPSNSADRQSVLTAAGNLATAFQTTAGDLTTQRANLDLSIGQTVNQINVLSSQIAQVNQQISSVQNLNQNAGALIDQRTTLIDQLSQLVDVSVVPSDNTITLTTTAGAALVSGGQSFALTAKPDASGVQHVFDAQGTDITSQISSGSLAGILEVRDQDIPSVLSNLDTLASGIANAINSAQQSGFDLNGKAGVDLFTPPPAGSGAAASMSVAITDPSLIAASSDGTPGSNGNIANLLAVQNDPVAGGQTPTNYFANIVFQVGSDVSNTSAESTASAQILQQLQDQRSSVSGVSLDEEAANMIQYQSAYNAAAQVISAINSMTETVIQMTTLTT